MTSNNDLAKYVFSCTKKEFEVFLLEQKSQKELSLLVDIFTKNYTRYEQFPHRDMVKSIAENNSHLRENITEILLDLLTKYTYGHGVQTCINVVDMIGDICSEEVLPSLLEVLKTSKGGNRYLVVRSLFTVGGSGSSLPRIASELLKDDDFKVRNKTIISLKEWDCDIKQKLLLPLLTIGECKQVIISALLALRDCPTGDIYTAMMKIADDLKLDWEIHYCAVGCLGEMGAVEAIPLLVRLMRTDDNDEICSRAAESLILIGDTRSIVMKGLRRFLSKYKNKKLAVAYGKIERDFKVLKQKK